MLVAVYKEKLPINESHKSSSLQDSRTRLDRWRRDANYHRLTLAPSLGEHTSVRMGREQELSVMYCCSFTPGASICYVLARTIAVLYWTGLTFTDCVEVQREQAQLALEEE